jgi:hypothetical protein
MKIERESGTLSLRDDLMVSALTTQQDLVAKSKFKWEAWPDRGDLTSSYRLILDVKGNKEGKVYFIVHFERTSQAELVVTSWMLAPENLITGEQHKPRGKVTKKLRQWFFEMTNVHLPIVGEWGHVDSSYDPHNMAGLIVCNYRSGFKSKKEWDDFLTWNP